MILFFFNVWELNQAKTAARNERGLPQISQICVDYSSENNTTPFHRSEIEEIRNPNPKSSSRRHADFRQNLLSLLKLLLGDFEVRPHSCGKAGVDVDGGRFSGANGRDQVAEGGSQVEKRHFELS